MSSLEEVWAFREEQLYPSLFGSVSRGIFVLDADLFAQVFDQHQIDPRWLHLGVIEFAPTVERPSWLYVTSGASNPWETEAEDYRLDDYSWLGVEFVIESPVQAIWPIHTLRRLLAYHVLVCHGRFEGYAPLEAGARVPAGGTIDGSRQSNLTFLALVRPWHYQASGQLDSGRFDFLHAVGITEEERDFARANSSDELIDLLVRHGAAPVTDPMRASVPLPTLDA